MEILTSLLRLFPSVPMRLAQSVEFAVVDQRFADGVSAINHQRNVGHCDPCVRRNRKIAALG